MKPGDTVEIAGYQLAFRGVAPSRGPNYEEQIGQFDVTRGGAQVLRLEPAKRIYDAPPQPTTEAGIHASWRGDLYVVLGDAQSSGGYAVRLYFNPLVRFIWIGAVIMFISGAVSLSDRRLRIGAPVRSRRRAMPVPAE
jgi:cytochrome c-type biogenesis protein CcmF